MSRWDTSCDRAELGCCSNMDGSEPCDDEVADFIEAADFIGLPRAEVVFAEVIDNFAEVGDIFAEVVDNFAEVVDIFAEVVDILAL